MTRHPRATGRVDALGVALIFLGQLSTLPFAAAGAGLMLGNDGASTSPGNVRSVSR